MLGISPPVQPFSQLERLHSVSNVVCAWLACSAGTTSRYNSMLSRLSPPDPPTPCPSFPSLLFVGIPCFFSPARKSLVFLAFFSRDFRGSVGIKHPCFFGWFSLPFSKKTRKGRTGPLLFWKEGKPRKTKNKGFPLCGTPRILGKGRKMHKKRKGNQGKRKKENKKRKEIEKSKDWRGSIRTHPSLDLIWPRF